MPRRGELEGRNGLKWLLKNGEPLHGEQNTEKARAALLSLTEELLRVRDRTGGM